MLRRLKNSYLYKNNMREKLLKLLRDIEKEQALKNDPKDSPSLESQKWYGTDVSYEEIVEFHRDINRNRILKYTHEKFFGEDGAYHDVRSFLVLPNYRLLVERLNGGAKENELLSENSILSELKRMESDGLVIIGFQTMQEYTFRENGDFTITLNGNGWESKTESITLATKGQNVSVGKNSLKLIHVEKIICVKPDDEDKKYQMIINDNYVNPLMCDRVKPSFDLLFKVAEGERPSAGEYKSNLDYFNTNKQNRIYTQTGLSLTKILKIIDGDIHPNIVMDVISEKALATRQNKSE